ncbi:MAG: bifunctional 4-hydroxy-2-oxoglutarate aldolase/2-dehydro-3-deoxy-phosphogluconate aldolase [Oscillospiraceae bacterium]|nr:bifunctional 4-hydroxy-2-oxoglutarate aldolase/2-dehydro-3-deoxy-phosphogluconate aldolase [Oscillospiraceae bacterium]
MPAIKEKAIEAIKTTGVLPCVKLHEKGDFVGYAKAMYDGGARAVEITMTTPGVLEAIAAISGYFKDHDDKLYVAAGTVLDAPSAREVILHGGSVLVNPCVIPEVIDMGLRYGVPVLSGAFTATECFNAMRAGASMVKIFPGALGGPEYMTNLKMVFPSLDLIPSGGITPENAGDFIKCGACAVSGARTFMDMEKIEQYGIEWVTKQVKKFIDIIKEAKKHINVIP